MKPTQQSRRSFLSKTSKASLAIGIGSSVVGSSLMSSCSSTKKTTNSTIFRTGFDQKPLPYDYKALEPYIDAMTMELHYSKHAAAYAKNLNDAALAEGIDRTKPLEDIFGTISKYSDKLRNNAGGHYNHELFWQSMRPAKTDNRAAGALLQALETRFGSFANFKSQFSDAGKARFGSGWAWLVLFGDKQKDLVLTSTANQDNPLMDIAGTRGVPILGLDVWEHAYYLKYQNKRADYIENWWNLVNWDFIQQRYDIAIK
jgi:superoxide dismutase, Fe-Mn family